MKHADSSVIVAAFASWHEFHTPSRGILDQGVGVAAHSVLESYSVLTRLPPPHRAPAGLVHEFLKERFPGPYTQLDDVSYRRFLKELPSRRIWGGASYDALIAAVAASAKATLVTCDRRAESIYREFGISVEIIGE